MDDQKAPDPSLLKPLWRAAKLLGVTSLANVSHLLMMEFSKILYWILCNCRRGTKAFVQHGCNSPARPVYRVSKAAITPGYFELVVFEKLLRT